jgi:hypothetical protein
MTVLNLNQPTNSTPSNQAGGRLDARRLGIEGNDITALLNLAPFSSGTDLAQTDCSGGLRSINGRVFS